MVYQPKIILNPSNKVVEFMYDSIPYIFQPKEKRLLNGDIAYHALRMVNAGLVEADLENEPEEVIDSVDYSKMPWKQLVALGSKKGVFKPGIQRKALEQALSDVQG